MTRYLRMSQGGIGGSYGLLVHTIMHPIRQVLREVDEPEADISPLAVLVIRQIAEP